MTLNFGTSCLYLPSDKESRSLLPCPSFCKPGKHCTNWPTAQSSARRGQSFIPHTSSNMLYSQWWPWAHGPFVPTLQVLGLQNASITRPTLTFDISKVVPSGEYTQPKSLRLIRCPLLYPTATHQIVFSSNSYPPPQLIFPFQVFCDSI